MLHHCPEPGVDSRLWHSRHWWRALRLPELRVVLCADSIEVFLILPAHWPGQRARLLQHWLLPVTHAAIACAEPVPNAGLIGSTGLQPAKAVWDTLAEVLADLPKRVHATLVVSNRYARFLVTPWQARLAGTSEWAAYHRHCLEQHFGEQAADWHLLATGGAYGQAQLVSAVDAHLLTEARDRFAQAGICLSALTPAWMLSVNHSLHQMRRQKLAASGWMLCRETDGLTLGSVHTGGWVSVDYQPLLPPAASTGITTTNLSTDAALTGTLTVAATACGRPWTDTLWQMQQRAQWTDRRLEALPLWTQDLAWPDSAQQAFPGLTVHRLPCSAWPDDRLQRSMQKRAA